MNIYVISDCHLKFSDRSEEKQHQQKIIDFLVTIEKKADILILNGDIFDLWFSWGNVIIKQYFPILKKLADLRENGCRLIFISGNHDFWFGSFLSEYLGMEIYRDNFIEKIDGIKIFVSHGDLYTHNDLRYKIFRRLVRCRLVMWLFSLIHPDLALKIGTSMSRSSRNMKIPKKLKAMREKGLIFTAREKLKVHDLVVFGHSHNPVIHRFDNGIYVNSGDWLIHDSFLQIENGKVELKEYKEKE